jgi:integrase
MPAHHKLEQFIDEYLAAAGIREDGKTPLFRSAIGKTGVLTDKPMNRIDAYRMVRRRTTDAGFKVKLGCHVFRATGITAYLEAGGHGCARKPAHDQALRSHGRRDHARRGRADYDLIRSPALISSYPQKDRLDHARSI